MNCVSNNQKSEIENDENDFDVVIVGAGLSGLTAANRLTSAGLNTLLIEKQDFLGGRLLSEEHSKSYYVHESQYNINRLINKFNLTKNYEKYPESRKLVYCKPVTWKTDIPFYIAAEVHYFIKIINHISKTYNLNTSNENINVTKLSNFNVKDLLHNIVFFTKSRSLCRILIQITCGTHRLEKISAFWYLRMLNGAGGFLQRLKVNLGDRDRYYVKGGAMRVVQLLANKIETENKIHYGEEVVKIQFSDDRAHVWSETTHYKCNYVIFAVPYTNYCRVFIEPSIPSCIKQTEIETRNTYFNAMCEPERVTSLDDCDTAVKNVIMFEEINENFTLIYDAACLEDKKLHFAGFSSGNEMSMSNLIGVINKYYACRISNFDKFLTRNGSLMNVFEPNEWSKSCSLVRNFGRIIFAGSEYGSHWPGTMDGAVESGEIAAFSILQSIRPQSINRSEWIWSKEKLSTYEKLKTEVTLLHNICFWINIYVSISFLHSALSTMMKEV